MAQEFYEDKGKHDREERELNKLFPLKAFRELAKRNSERDDEPRFVPGPVKLSFNRSIDDIINEKITVVADQFVKLEGDFTRLLNEKQSALVLIHTLEQQRQKLSADETEASKAFDLVITCIKNEAKL